MKKAKVFRNPTYYELVPHLNRKISEDTKVSERGIAA
jgi:hypothetical protein